MSTRMDVMRTEIGTIRREFADDFHKTARATRNNVMKTLKPGETAPAENRIYGSESRKDFEDRAYEYREKARSVIANAKKSLDAEIAKAPSADAVNAISLASLQSRVSREDIDTLLSVYGSNVLAYESIREIAKKNNIQINEHPLKSERKEIESTAKNIEDMTLYGAENGNAASNAMIQFTEWWNGNGYNA